MPSRHILFTCLSRPDTEWAAVPDREDRTWIAGQRNSDDDGWIWPSGYRVDHNLAASMGGENHLALSGFDFKIYDLPDNTTIGVICETRKSIDLIVAR